MLVSHPMLAPHTNPSRRKLSINSLNRVRSERNPGDDLFHEPEAQPVTVTARVPPEATLRGHRSR
jgi:hypothetical protein